MPVPLAVPLITGAVSFISGLFGSSAAKRAEQKAAAEKAAAQRSLNALINDRQDIINPFEDVKDLSSMLSNPMANLSVATQAAEIQVEEADISLANTLDTVRATGASAGGATALAQAALASKKGVASSIEQQEVNNEKLRAQGESKMEQMQMQEAQRIQGVQIAEGQRMQSQQAAGNQFTMQMKENRTNQDLGRAAGQEQQAMANQAAANQAQAQAWGSAISGVAGIATSIGSAVPGSEFNPIPEEG